MIRGSWGSTITPEDLEGLEEIDGSIMEGGGQILRMSLIFSALTGKPIRIFNIRHNRKRPGLMDQHTTGICLVARICKAKVDGVEPGSTLVTFVPGQIRGGWYEAIAGTAASISLLMQLMIPCLLLADRSSHVRLRGGTNTSMAPQVEYMTEVFRANLQKFGGYFKFTLKHRGYYPRGGGEVEVEINPISKLRPIEMIDDLTDHIDKVVGWSFVAGTIPIGVAHEMAEGAIRCLKERSPAPKNISIERYKESPDMVHESAAGIVLVAYSKGAVFGGSSLLTRDFTPRQVGEVAGGEINETRGLPFDQYMEDQLIVLMALADGVSKVRYRKKPTMHTETAIFIAEKLTNAKFQRDGDILECTGIGMKSLREA